MFTRLILSILFCLSVIQANDVKKAKAKKIAKQPTEKDQLKEMSERLDIISQATDHFKFFRECFMDYEDPSDIATFTNQLDQARRYLPRSLDKLDTRLKKFSRTSVKDKAVNKLMAVSAKLRHKVKNVLELGKDDLSRIELGMKRYMNERMLEKGIGGADQFAQEASEISETLKKLRPKECVSGNCDALDI